MPRVLFLVACLALALLSVIPSAFAFPQTITRISMSYTGGEANNSALYPTISLDGRFVAFVSGASNLVPADTNNATDAFVYDRATGTIEMVSVSSTGTQGTSFGADRPDISANGRFVVFQSKGFGLVPGDTNDMTDIFVHDRDGNTITRVSVTSAGGQAVRGHSEAPSISGDGRFVAFSSTATNLAPDTESGGLFLHDRQAGSTLLISRSPTGAPANAGVNDPSLSGDGRYVAFSSAASNLVVSDTNRTDDVFVRDMQAGTTRRVSVTSAGGEANQRSTRPVLSANGRYVAFESMASNLAPNDANGIGWDVFLHDTQTSTTALISGGSPAGTSSDAVGSISISNDGRWVVFHSDASGLMSGDTNGMMDVFLYDAQTKAARLISGGLMGAQSNETSGWPSISGDGRFLAFYSAASNLVPGDTNKMPDLFMANLQPALPTFALSSFTAARSNSGVVVRWQTTSETGVLGYNVYRGTAIGPEVRVNSARIPLKAAQLSMTGLYEVLDASPTSGGTYWLEVVGADGASEWVEEPASAGVQVYLPVLRK
jgi:Tol biopolymer transport system component